MDLDENWGRESVEVEELNGFVNTVLDIPPLSITFDDVFSASLEVVGDKKSRLFSPMVFHDDLTDDAIFC